MSEVLDIIETHVFKGSLRMFIGSEDGILMFEIHEQSMDSECCIGPYFPNLILEQLLIPVGHLQE